MKPALSAAANLAFWARIHGTPPAAVPGALEALALGPLAGRPAGTLSAGQRRRLGLARLMVSGRRLWLMDEPTVALDAASVALVAGLVRAHLAAGGAALIATHADVGLPEAAALDLAPYRARAGAGDGFERGVA